MTNIVEQARAVQHPACKPLVNELADEIERLRAALGFYANIETYRGHGMQDAEIIHDGGQIARRALENKP